MFDILKNFLAGVRLSFSGEPIQNSKGHSRQYVFDVQTNQSKSMAPLSSFCTFLCLNHHRARC